MPTNIHLENKRCVCMSFACVTNSIEKKNMFVTRNMLLLRCFFLLFSKRFNFPVKLVNNLFCSTNFKVDL